VNEVKNPKKVGYLQGDETTFLVTNALKGRSLPLLCKFKD